MIELLQIYLRGLAGIAVGLLGLGFLSPPAWGNVFEQGAGQLVQAVSGLDASEGKYAGLDLHVHTYCSDGEESPETVVQKAKDQGVEVLAVTDHDTMACVARAQEQGRRLGVRVVRGIEVSAGPGSIHILGLGVNPDDPGIQKIVGEAGVERIRRARAIVEKLNQLQAGLQRRVEPALPDRSRVPQTGPPIDFALDLVLTRVNKERALDGLSPLTTQEARDLGEGKLLDLLRGEITRPDIARVLVQKGYASSVKEAFEKYIGNEGPAYEEMRSPDFDQIISIIHQAGGVAILAHPFTVFKPQGDLAKRYGDFESLLKAMVAAELDGLEFYRPQNKYLEKDQHRTLEALQTLSEEQRGKLLLTPASDYHGGEIGAEYPGGLAVPASEAYAILRALNSNSYPAP